MVDLSLHQFFTLSNSLEQDTNEEITDQKNRHDALIRLMPYQGVVDNLILLLSSFYVLYVILFVRKRHELFLVLIPAIICF